MSKLVRALSCGTVRRRPPSTYETEEKKTVASTSSKKDDYNFWQIDGYEAALDRCNDGNELCEDLISMINERAKVEENYSKALLEWQAKWTTHLKTKSKEYGTTKEACQGMLDTAQKLSDYHLSLQASLIDKTKSPVAEIKNWMKQHYAKAHIHFKKRNEFLEQFKYAQKPWAEYYEELKKSEKHYHSSVKDSIKTDQEAKSAEKNPRTKEEDRSKLRKEAEKSTSLQAKERSKYENQLKIADKFKQNYLEDMKRVFDRTQAFEISRMEFFKQIYQEFKGCFAKSALYDAKAKDAIFNEFTDKTTKMDPKKDTSWWSDNYGAGMMPEWPSFTEYKSN